MTAGLIGSGGQQSAPSHRCQVCAKSWLWRFEFYCGGLRPPIIPPKSIFVYPAGSSKVAAGGAPSLTLVNSMLVPSEASVLIGKKSFWSIHAVLTLPFLSVVF